jgi:hypothetical protein
MVDVTIFYNQQFRDDISNIVYSVKKSFLLHKQLYKLYVTFFSALTQFDLDFDPNIKEDHGQKLHRYGWALFLYYEMEGNQKLTTENFDPHEYAIIGVIYVVTFVASQISNIRTIENGNDYINRKSLTISFMKIKKILIYECLQLHLYHGTETSETHCVSYLYIRVITKMSKDLDMKILLILLMYETFINFNRDLKV